jgi:hypothetical protein
MRREGRGRGQTKAAITHQSSAPIPYFLTFRARIRRVTRTPERIGKMALTIISTIEREVSAIVKCEGRDRLELKNA